MGEDKLSGCQIRSWRAVSAAGLQGKGSCRRSAFPTDTGMLAGTPLLRPVRLLRVSISEGLTQANS